MAFNFSDSILKQIDRKASRFVILFTLILRCYIKWVLFIGEREAEQGRGRAARSIRRSADTPAHCGAAGQANGPRTSRTPSRHTCFTAQPLHLATDKPLAHTTHGIVHLSLSPTLARYATPKLPYPAAIRHLASAFTHWAWRQVYFCHVFWHSVPTFSSNG